MWTGWGVRSRCLLGKGRSAGPPSPLCRCPLIFMRLMPTAYSRSRIGAWPFLSLAILGPGVSDELLSRSGISARVLSCPFPQGPFRSVARESPDRYFCLDDIRQWGSLSHLPGSGDSDTGPTIYRSQRDKSLHIPQSRILGPNLVEVGQKVSMAELYFHHGLISLLAPATNLSRHATVSKCRGCRLLTSLL